MKRLWMTLLFIAMTATFAEAGAYGGKHSDWVRKLLSRAAGWSCPQTPPQVDAQGCARDPYVAAAVMYAWAAECYAAKGEHNLGAEHAGQMVENLRNAEQLCSDSPATAQGRDCATRNLYACGAL